MSKSSLPPRWISQTIMNCQFRRTSVDDGSQWKCRSLPSRIDSPSRSEYDHEEARAHHPDDEGDDYRVIKVPPWRFPTHTALRKVSCTCIIVIETTADFHARWKSSNTVIVRNVHARDVASSGMAALPLECRNSETSTQDLNVVHWPA